MGDLSLVFSFSTMSWERLMCVLDTPMSFAFTQLVLTHSFCINTEAMEIIFYIDTTPRCLSVFLGLASTYFNPSVTSTKRASRTNSVLAQHSACK